MLWELGELLGGQERVDLILGLTFKPLFDSGVARFLRRPASFPLRAPNTMSAGVV